MADGPELRDTGIGDLSGDSSADDFGNSAGSSSGRPILSRETNPYDELDRYDEDRLISDEVPEKGPTSVPFFSAGDSRAGGAPTSIPTPVTTLQPPVPLTPPQEKKGIRWPWSKKEVAQPEALSDYQQAGQPAGQSVGPTGELGQYVVNPVDGTTVFVPAPLPQPIPKAWWQKQPYLAIAHLAAFSGTVTTAWLFGLLVAQFLPGNFEKPPLQEAFLRKSSRLTSRLFHIGQLWQTPTVETRIEAIPLPNTGPVIEPVELSPIERQPLIDELNSIETEILTLDRRMETLEQQLGRPPYEGADIDNRLNSLRTAIDPPVRSPLNPDDYTPTPIDPNDTLLDVARLRITLPSDALFSPGQSELKENALLKQVLDQLVNYPESTIVVRSYSDDQATPSDSRDYTLAQANALSVYLKASLPGTYRWVAVGGGQSLPVESNDEDTGRQRNRRIEILVDTR